MWGSAEEPPGTMEAGPPETAASIKDSYEKRKTQLDSLKDIMLKSKQSLKKKEEDPQEYSKASKFKTRTKRSHHQDDLSSIESDTPKSRSDSSFVEVFEDVDDINQATTPKAKASLLQQKLAEDRKIFEQRSKEMTESKRAVEEKVEALRLQLEENYATPNLGSTLQPSQSFLDISYKQEKESKILELTNKIIELEAIIIDLKDNLKEKDSVIDSKTKAVTLISADLSEKGKSTLDTLEETKDEMRLMQNNFVLVETSLRDKNDNLLKQLEEKANQVASLEESLQRLTDQLDSQIQSESVTADLSRSTMETLTDTKDAMKSMQENFVLVEESLKAKNEHLLKQLEEQVIKLAEADAKILNLESGLGIERHPDFDNLTIKIDKLEDINRKLADEKYELQKTIAELQNKVISSELEGTQSNEKDNKIAELEDNIEELKKFYIQTEQDYKSEFQKQIDELTTKNEEMSAKVSGLEKQVEDLQVEKSDLTNQLLEAGKDEDTVQKLNQELDALNKSMIKLKTSHKNKLKSLQKQLENFKQVSDVNAELVQLANQVALLEEEKGNLQLSLVDFDELKATSSEWKKQVEELEGKLASQAKEIETRTESIAMLENQKLDLMQELHTTKQEVSDLEAENAESEILRVSAEMKVVELEEQLEKLQSSEIQRLAQENERLQQKLNEVTSATKNSSEVGSTESFVKTGSNVDSTESFEALAADTERSDLMKKIESLTKENEALIEKITKLEDKAASDGGSTESFEKLSDNTVETLTRENEELDNKMHLLIEENERLIAQVIKLQAESENLSRDKRSIDEESNSTIEPGTESGFDVNDELAAKINSLTTQIKELEVNLKKAEDEKNNLAVQFEQEGKQQDAEARLDIKNAEKTTIANLKSEVKNCHTLIAEQQNVIDDIEYKLSEKQNELESRAQDSTLDFDALHLKLEESAKLTTEWKLKYSELEDKVVELEKAKQRIDESFKNLHSEYQSLIEESQNKDALITSLEDKLNNSIFELQAKYEEKTKAYASQEDEVDQLQKVIKEKDNELHQKYGQIQNDLIKIDELQENILQLEEKLIQKDATIASLSEEVETLRTNSSVIEEDLFLTRHQMQELRDKLDSSSKNIEEYNLLIEKLSDKDSTHHLEIAEIEKKLCQKISEIDGLRFEIESITAENRQLQEMASAEKRQTADLFEANEVLEKDLRDAERAKNEFEKKLSDLQSENEQNLRHAHNVTNELQQAYKSLELLKLKHTEEVGLFNQRLDQVLDELQEKTDAVEKCVSEDYKNSLESKIADLERALVESEEKSQGQIEKMKKYAAVAKKRSQQCEEIEAKLKELEMKLQIEIEDKNKELEKYSVMINEQENKITEINEQLKLECSAKEQALLDLENVRFEFIESQNKIKELSEEITQLSEAKDNARELGVRMGVMETEYVEQLTLINSLRTENGLLLSKQAQINERLENVEKESEERRALLEKLEKEKEIADSQLKQCEPCSQCASLEAKLQERNAEIENLDNELHNSIANLVQMQESLRLSTVSDTTYNELMQSYNVLTAANEDVKAKFEMAVKENGELNNRILGLLTENDSMKQKIEILETELSKQKELETEYESLQTRYTALLESFEKQKSDLEAIQVKLRDEEVLNSVKTEEPSNDWDLESITPVTSFETQKGLESHPTEHEIQPFDSSMFGETTSIQTSNEQDQELQRLNNLVSVLSNRIEEASIAAAEAESSIRSELDQAKAKIASLTATLSLANTSLETKNVELESLKAEFDRLIGIEMERDQDQIKLEELKEIKRVLSSLTTADEASPAVEKLRDLGVKLNEAMNELDMIKNENKLLLSTQESHIRRVIELENEIKSSGESAIIADLESSVLKVSQERDLLQLQFNDATRAFEDLRENTAGLSKLQMQLDIVVQERNQLTEEIKALRSSVNARESQKEDSTIVSMWDDDEMDPWGAGAVSDIVPTDTPLKINMEVELKRRVEELQEKLQELNEENSKLTEESKTAQIKIVKYVKKLKEYKVQLDNLQQEIKTLKSLGGGFGDLDLAIEEELKNQVETLEKALSESKEELKKAAAEKISLTNRIDVLTAATERFTEAKEKQDVEVHIWQKRYKEIEMKLQQMEGVAPVETQEQPQSSSAPCGHEELMKDLRENIDALAAENDELQQLLEEHRSKLQSAEKSANQIAELESSRSELEAILEKSKQNYDTLRRQYEQSLMDTDDEIKLMRDSYEQLNSEMAQKDLDISSLKATVDSQTQEIAVLKEQIELLENEKIEINITVVSLKQSLADKQTLIDELNSVIKQKEETATIADEMNAQGQEIEILRNQLQIMELKLAEEKEKAKNDNRTIQTLQLALDDKEKETDIKIIELELAVKEQERLATEAASDLNEALLEKEHLMEALAELKTVVDEKEQTANAAVEGLKQALLDKERLTYVLAQNEMSLESVKNELEQLKMTQEAVVSAEDKAQKESDMPVFTFSNDGNKDKEFELLKEEVQAKNEMIEHLQFSIDDGTMTKIIQGLQDEVNALYNERTALEEQLIVKNQEIHALKSQLAVTDEHLLKQSPVDHYEQSLNKLSQELQSRDQELNALKLLVREREDQLREAVDSNQRSTIEAELEEAKLTISELENKLAHLQQLDDNLAAERANIKEMLNENDEYNTKIMQEKEEEINRLKEQISFQQQDIANLKLQIEQNPGYSQHLAYLQFQLEERDRALESAASQLAEKTAQLNELSTLGGEEVNQLQELRSILEVKEQQINGLTLQLEEKKKQYELAQHALQRHIGEIDTKVQLQPVFDSYKESLLQMKRSQNSESKSELPSQTNELDAALYMLYQRDIRCEELTQELMQLLEERDTLQLRLSDALREKYTVSGSGPKAKSDLQQQVASEDPSSSTKSEDLPELDEKTTSLAQKLSELKSVDQNRDIRLTDDRMVRHNEQMTLYVPHGDLGRVLSPEAIANISQVRNVPSQSSGLMDWLWGKS